MNQQIIKKRYCPFVQDPHDECYCAKLDSQNIENTIYYCGKNFLDCEIYRILLLKQGQPTNSNYEK